MNKLLIVDDELDVCDFVKGFFEERDYIVFTALDGEAAIRIVKKQRPDIILLDIKMKRMNGIDALRKIRELDKTACVIMVTAVEDQDKMDAAYELGAKSYITKPLVLEELERTVYELSKT